MPISPELDFLRLCCMRDAALDFSDRIAALSTQIPRWSRLIEKLAQHGVDGLAYTRLLESASGVVPEGVMGALADRVAVNAAASLRHLSELAGVLAALAAADVAAVPIDGPPLSATLYGKASLRPCQVLSLLMQQRGAATELAGLGYAATPADETIFRSPGKLDLAIAFGLRASGSFLSFDDLLPRCTLLETGGLRTWMLAPEDLLLLVCLRGANRGWDQWLLLCDVDAVLRANPALDLHASLGHSFGTVVRHGLILASRLLNSPVPEPLLAQALRDQEAVLLAEEASARLLESDSPGACPHASTLHAGSATAKSPEARQSRPAPGGARENGQRIFRAYRIIPGSQPPVPAPPNRLWMDQTDLRFAYRCLPLMMANQAGWNVLNTHTIEAEWDGGVQMESVRVRVLSGEGKCAASSHFGYGVLTWSIPFLFRTPPGYNLWVRGPINLPKDGISALEGLVETDWLSSTFTMNWKFTRPGHTVRFEEGEPICCVLPQRRSELEEFDTVLAELDDSPEDASAFRSWSASRDLFMDLSKSSFARPIQSWQKHYFNGETISGERFGDHQQKLTLGTFHKGSPPKVPGDSGKDL